MPDDEPTQPEVSGENDDHQSTHSHDSDFASLTRIQNGILHGSEAEKSTKKQSGLNEPTNPVTWFEIPVTDMDRAQAFYESVLGTQLTMTEMGPNQMGRFPMEMGRMGAAGTLILGEGYTPSQAGSVVYFTLSSIDDALGRVESSGGKHLMPRTDIGQHGFIAHIEDTEGNRIALHEPPAK